MRALIWFATALAAFALADECGLLCDETFWKTATKDSVLELVDAGADVNTVNSSATGEPTGSDVILNIVSLTQAEYDAGTKIATTFYIIN